MFIQTSGESSRRRNKKKYREGHTIGDTAGTENTGETRGYGPLNGADQRDNDDRKKVLIPLCVCRLLRTRYSQFARTPTPASRAYMYMYIDGRGLISARRCLMDKKHRSAYG